MTRPLEGKNIILTGASGGIGRAMTEAFANSGANIWAVTSRANEDYCHYASNMAAENGVWIKPIVGDLTDSNTLKSVVMGIRADKLSIDGLVNNAGVLREGLLQMMSLDVARSMFDINFFAPLQLMQFVTRIMTRQSNGGAIINMSSVAAFDGIEGESVYGATKAALTAASKSLAKELGRFGVRVNCIAPGVTETPLISGMHNDVLDRVKNSTYLRRLGVPEDIASVAVFLLSDAAKHITGQVIRVDGGLN